MWLYTPGLLQSYKSDLDDEIDGDFGWGTCWVYDWDKKLMSWHIHEVYSWWCWYILMSHSWWVVDTWLVHTSYMVGCTCLCWLQVGAWLMHFFMVQVDYRLMHGWCMVQIYWYKFTAVYLTVIVWQWFHHSTSTSGWQDGARTGGCSHLPVVAGEHWGL